MTSQELLAAVNKEHPDIIEKTAEALSILEELEPEFAKELAEDIALITDVTLQKTASIGSIAGRAALGLGSAVGVGIAGAVAGDLYDAAKRGLTKGTNLKRILANNPELQRGNRKAVITSFNTLHRYAPEFTADPMLGGQILNRMIELPNDQLNLVKDLLSSRKVLREAKKNQFSLGKTEFPRGGKSLGDKIDDEQTDRAFKQWLKSNPT